MSPAHVLEPTYNALRRRLVGGGWPPGYRLEAVRLAEDLGVSITPVRDALNRLTGERLVDSEPGEGFRVPRLGGSDLRATIAWHHRLMIIAVRWRAGPLPRTDIPQSQGGIEERAALVFGSIAAIAGNPELNRAVSQTAARLSHYRQGEATVFPDVDAELDGIERLARDASRAPLLEAIGRYHSRREAAADRLAHLPKAE